MIRATDHTADKDCGSHLKLLKLSVRSRDLPQQTLVVMETKMFKFTFCETPPCTAIVQSQLSNHSCSSL